MKTCPICLVAFGPHPGEKTSNYAKRATCGRPSCVASWRIKRNRSCALPREPASVPPEAPGAWAGFTKRSFRDDPRAAVEVSYGARLIRRGDRRSGAGSSMAWVADV